MQSEIRSVVYASRFSRRTIHSKNSDPAMTPSSQCICAWANSWSGAPLSSFTSARLAIASAERFHVVVAVNGRVELLVVNAARLLGERRQQRFVSLGVRAFQIGHANLQVAAERLLVRCRAA